MTRTMAFAAGTVGGDADDRGISPELVLVDPELSGRVRARVPLLFLRRKPPLPALHALPDAAPSEAPSAIDPRSPAVG